MREDFERLYQRFSKEYQLPEERHFNMFEIRNGKLYYKGADRPLMYDKGKLRVFDSLICILGKNRLCNLGFHISKSSKIMARQAVLLNRVEEELPSASDVAKADDIEFQGIMENATRSMEDFITQLDN